MSDNLKKKYLFTSITNLPNEIIEIIKQYIPIYKLIFVQKKYYLKYHHLLKPFISKFNIENYIRNVIVRDHNFVFERLINENIKHWMNIKQYIYKNTLYANYLYFLKDFCLYHDSNKCRLVLNKFLQENGLCKNQHKKNTSKHIRWNN
jgi:hypothetical protein